MTAATALLESKHALNKISGEAVMVSPVKQVGE